MRKKCFIIIIRKHLNLEKFADCKRKYKKIFSSALMFEKFSLSKKKIKINIYIYIFDFQDLQVPSLKYKKFVKFREQFFKKISSNVYLEGEL